MYSELGVDLYIIKLRASLPKLLADASSYSTGKVRVDCIQGLRKFGQLRHVEWARQADVLDMYPSTFMIRLVDKKFGGELVKSDLLGVEVEEYDSDDVDGGTIALGGGGGGTGGGGTGGGGGGDGFSRLGSDDGRSSAAGARSRVRSNGRSQKSRRSNKSKKAARRRPKALPIDCNNETYLIMREEARQHRLAINWLQVNYDSLTPLAEIAQVIRQQWRGWNPQREAARKLEEEVMHGTISLEETVREREAYYRAEELSQYTSHPKPSAERCAGTGLVNPQEASLLGRHPHSKPFLWPSPKVPGTFASLEAGPTSLFIAEPWIEGEAQGGGGGGGGPNDVRGGYEPGLPLFNTNVKNPAGIFEPHPEVYFKTVHSGGEGRAKEEAETRLKEKEEWQKKVVVSDVHFKATIPRGPDKVAQVDKFKGILRDATTQVKSPSKIPLDPPPPLSIFTPSDTRQATQALSGDTRKFDPSLSMAPVDFERYKVVLPSMMSQVAKPPVRSTALHNEPGDV